MTEYQVGFWNEGAERAATEGEALAAASTLGVRVTGEVDAGNGQYLCRLPGPVLDELEQAGEWYRVTTFAFRGHTLRVRAVADAE